MQLDTILPEGFDGVFRFTNPTDEDFVGKWDSREYLYPANKTTPMLILNASPLEVQNIRKKFARELAEREFFKSQKGKLLASQERNADGSARFGSIHQAAGYNESDLTPFIQRCLEPLPTAKASVRETTHEPIENKLSKTDDGELVTEAIDKKTSLRKRALEAK